MAPGDSGSPAGGPPAPRPGPLSGLMAWLTRVTGSGHEASRLRPSERTRVPPPVIRRRLPSGRGAMEQPNCTGDGDAPLTPRFWLVLVVAGIATGLFGAFLMAILYNVSYLAFGYHGGSFQTGVEHATGLRRVVSLVVAGVIGAVAWYLVRRFLKDENAQIDDAVWSGDGQLSLRRAVLTSIISEFVIGMGASLGREAAPKLMGGATASVLGTWSRLSPAQRRLLVACAVGGRSGCRLQRALAGALFTAEILVGSLSAPGDAAGPRLLVDRHGRLMGLPAHPRRLRRAPRLPLHDDDPGLGGPGRAGHRGHCHGIHPTHRLGLSPPGLGGRDHGRHAPGLWRPRRHRHLVPRAVRQREGHGVLGLPGQVHRAPAARPVPLEAAGDLGLPGVGCVRGCCSPRP